MANHLPLCTFLSLVCLHLNPVIGEPSKFIRSETLADYYLLTWEVDIEQKNVTFEVKAQTTGYVGFGVNTIGGMQGADIVIGGVFDNGTSYFADRHGLGSYLPPEDNSQDWFLLDAHEADGWTTIKFTRGFYPCDQEEDIQLTNDTLRVIFSVGATDKISYHEKRGTKSLILLSPPSPPVDVSNFESWKLAVNTAIPAVDTAYWVTIHKSPKFTSKAHMVGFQVLIENEAADKYTHHMVLHRCSASNGVNLTEVLGPWVSHPGGISDDPSIISIRGNCNTFLYVWAKGGSPLILPDHVGIPIGETSEEEYFLLEVHYDNPTIDSGVQYETGVTIYYTRELRAHDAGVLYTGLNVDPGHIIPPNVSDFVHVGHCSPECTQAKFPSDGINVFSVLLHSHLNGRKLRLRHYRQSEELPWIANDGNYDFNYQQDRAITNEVKVMPGDQLTVECFYDSTWRNPPSAAYHGESTRHEMCQAFVLYYPLIREIDFCASSYRSIDGILNPLGIDGIDTSSSSEYPIVTGPEDMRGLTLLEALNNRVNWTSSLVDYLQYEQRWAPQLGICLSFANPSGGPFVYSAYPNATAYEPVFSCQ